MAKRNPKKWGGFLDFNSNGKVEPWELWMVNQMIKHPTQKERNVKTEDICMTNNFSPLQKKCDNTNSSMGIQHNWKQNCPDGSEYGVFPDDFDNETDYLEALEEAKFEWREYCPDGTEYGIVPEDYETEEEYIEALTDAEDASVDFDITISFDMEYDEDMTVEIKEADYPNRRTYLAALELASIQGNNCKSEMENRCSFVLDNPDLIAAQYYSISSGFLYAQAVKENFEIPVDFPDEDEWTEINFFYMIQSISQKSIPLSLEIWNWCVYNFMPYIEFAHGFDEELLTSTIIDHLYEMPEGFLRGLVRYIDENPEFSKRIIRCADKISHNTYMLLNEALLESNVQVAKTLFTDVLKNDSVNMDIISGIVDTLVYCCKTWKEIERINVFKEYLLPILRIQDNLQCTEYVDELEKEIDSYCHDVQEQIQYKNTIFEKRIQLDILVDSIKNIVNRIESNDVWEKIDENAPEFITYEFVYPNGKNGDIDMFIASNYGEQLDKLDELHYSVRLPIAHKEQILLLEYSYIHSLYDDISRNELNQFLYEYNLGHKLRQYCDTYLAFGGHISEINQNDENRFNYSQIRSHAIIVANQYMEKVRQERNKVYEKIVMQGLTSARWTSEQKAYLIVKNIYKDAIFQYRDEWLGLQSLDIYIPCKRIAIEYQGKQHFEPIPIFGGGAGLKQVKIRDEQKKKKCMENDVHLIEWRYDEPLTQEFIICKIAEIET